jgi:hypothetical protein
MRRLLPARHHDAWFQGLPAPVIGIPRSGKGQSIKRIGFHYGALAAVRKVDDGNVRPHLHAELAELSEPEKPDHGPGGGIGPHELVQQDDVLFVPLAQVSELSMPLLVLLRTHRRDHRIGLQDGARNLDGDLPILPYPTQASG